MATWEFKGRELVNCSCDYGCNCQFNGLPDKGHCYAVAGIQIDEGHHGDTRLDGLRVAAIFKWPGAIHEGNGEALAFVDARADQGQRRHHAVTLTPLHAAEDPRLLRELVVALARRTQELDERLGDQRREIVRRVRCQFC